MNTFFPTNIACLFGCSLKVVVLLNSQTHLPHIFGLGRDGGFLVKIDKRNLDFLLRAMVVSARSAGPLPH